MIIDAVAEMLKMIIGVTQNIIMDENSWIKEVRALMEIWFPFMSNMQLNKTITPKSVPKKYCLKKLCKKSPGGDLGSGFRKKKVFFRGRLRVIVRDVDVTSKGRIMKKSPEKLMLKKFRKKSPGGNFGSGFRKSTFFFADHYVSSYVTSIVTCTRAV